jgi:hypothetical protein
MAYLSSQGEADGGQCIKILVIVGIIYYITQVLS